MAKGKWVKKNPEVVNEMVDLLKEQQANATKEVNKPIQEVEKPKEEVKKEKPQEVKQTKKEKDVVTFYSDGIPKKYKRINGYLYPIEEDR